MLEFVVIWLTAGLLGVALWCVLEKLNMGEVPLLIESVVSVVLGPIALLSGIVYACAFVATGPRGGRRSGPSRNPQNKCPEQS